MLRLCSRRLCATTSKGAVKLVEAPRDAMQGLKEFVPTASKVRYLQSLLACGFDTLDCGSFVAAPLVPQMRDTAEVLDQLDMTRTKTKLLVVCANMKGTEKAVAQPKVTYVGYPLSASETFQRKNTNRSVAQALEDVAATQRTCAAGGKELVTFISMGFGNPYGEDFNAAVVERLVEQVAKTGCKIISLADTVGVSEPGIIQTLFSSLIPKYPGIEFGAHFHSGAVESSEKVKAALSSGCRRFDHALGGMGGCPFAKSTLVGNVSTETVLDTLKQMGYSHNIDLAALDAAQQIKHDVFGVAVKEILLANVLHDDNLFADLCARHFKKADAKHVGSLGIDQFAQSVCETFAELGETQPSAEKIASKFREMDLSHDNKITLDEYMIGVRRFLNKRLARVQSGEMAH